MASHADRAAVTRLALAFGQLSPYTALVAVGSDVIVRGGVKHSVAVPVALPSGMRWDAVAPMFDVETSARGGKEAAVPAKPTRPTAEPAPTTIAPSTPAAPAPAPEPPRPAKRPAADDDGDDTTFRTHTRKPRPAPADKSGERAGGGVAAAPGAAAGATADAAKSPPAQAAGPRSTATVEEREASADADGGEAITVTGSSELVSVAARGWRLSTTLGGGLAVDHGAHGLGALGVRLEATTGLRLGGELALWLLDGVGGAGGVDGRAQATIARGLGRWLELGLGAGLQLGHDRGLAGSLRLRAQTPVRALAGVLRYDATLVLDRPQREAAQAFTLGLELAY